MMDFTEGDVLKQIIYFTVPVLLANLLQALYNIIDGIWVGRLIGHEAFASVSSVAPLIFFLLSSIMGITISTNILVGQAYGSKNKLFLSKVLSNSFMTNVILCIIISIFGIIFSNPLLDLLNTPPEIKQQSHIFFVIIISGLIFTFIYNWFSSILRGLGDSKTPFYLLIVSTILNIIFVPILILGLGPIPKLGVAGAGLGTVLSNAVMIIVSYYYCIKSHPLLNLREWDFTFDIEIVKKIFTIGIPASFQMAVVSLSGIFMMSLVNTFGAKLTAAYGIGIQLDQLTFMPAMAIGMSVTSMVAQNLGANQYNRVKEIVKYSVRITILFSILFFIIIYGFPKIVSSIFTTEPEVIGHTLKYIRIVSFTYFLFPIMFVLQGIVRGAGDTMTMLLFSLISLILFRYPTAYILSKYTLLQECGIWVGILLSSFVGVTLNYLYYISGKWQKSIIKQFAD